MFWCEPHRQKKLVCMTVNEIVSFFDICPKVPLLLNQARSDDETNEQKLC